MTITDPRIARQKRGCNSSVKLIGPARSAQIQRVTAIAPVMNDNRRAQRKQPCSSLTANLIAREVQLADMTVLQPSLPTQALEALMTRLDNSLEALAQSTDANDVSDGTEAREIVSELASIAKMMLQSTRIMAEEINRKELLTRILQSSLADAQRSAEVDYLTGLPNRRAFETFLKSELELAANRGEQICVAFVDLDHFKSVNDAYGHAVGDQVLKVVAQVLAKISDDKCHVARHGGEEFVVLFRGKSLHEAAAVLDDTREAVASWNLIGKLPPVRVTFSGGIADISAFETIGEALKAADDALYAAKSSGRDRIALAGSNESYRAAA
jgi:diguanylate cyclase